MTPEKWFNMTGTSSRATLHWRPRSRIPPLWLAAAAVLSVVLWLGAEFATRHPVHPRYAEMLNAARAMQAASRVLVAEREMRGLMQGREIDPNRTGMIGSEFTAITTTLGDLAAKRTTTNPDFAAALVRVVATLDLPRGTPVVIIVSGSFVGGNIAALAAAEALGLRPVVIASLGASMWGATDPQFNWLDITATLRERGVIRAYVAAAVLGGDGAVGGGMDAAGIAALRASAARDGVPVIEARPLAALIDALLGRVNTSIAEAATDKVPGEAKPGAIINVGGALIGLGSCRESSELPPGLTTRGLPCTAGTPGLAIRLTQAGAPLLHVLNIRRLAVELGLPFDPVPLPAPGNNAAIYGSGRRNGA
jgi:poly-gamma-glutamate system protein